MTRNRVCLAITLVLTAVTASPSTAFASEGDLDTSFGSGGTATTDVTPGNPDGGSGVAVDSEGRIVVAGTTKVGSQHVFAVARYLPNGTLDDSFGFHGIETQAIGPGGDDEATSVAIDSQGRIVVGGYSKSSTVFDFAVARFTSAGQLDTTGFNSPFGIRTTAIGSGDAHATGVAVDAQDRVVLAGESRSGAQQIVTLARYDATGALDSGFGTGGTVTLPFGSANAAANAVAIDAQGGIVAAGRARTTTSNNELAVARYTQGGALDPSFGGGTGYAINPISSSDNTAFGVAIDRQGRIVAAGGNTATSGNDEFAAVRYLADGTLDPSFGTGGVALTPIGTGNADAKAAAIDAQGRLVLAGFAVVNSVEDFALARYRMDGTLDPAFGANGIVTTNVGTGSPVTGGARAVTIDSTSRIVAAGDAWNGTNTDFGVARYIGDQTPPAVTVTSGPADGSFTNNAQPSFGFSTDDPTASANCAFDGATPFGCSSAAAPGAALADGTHTFAVNATDTVGNASAPVTRTFTVDTTAPTLTIKGKRRVRARHRARDRFKLKVSEPAIVACKLDRRKTKACSKRYKTPKLRFGKHKLRVTAVDRAGNVTTTLKRFKIVRKRH